MNFPSEPNETERTDFVHAVLHEAARYEAETQAPNDLVTAALARHNRSGRGCRQRRPVPVLVAATCGLVLPAVVGLWLRLPHRLAGERQQNGPTTALQSKQKPVLRNTPALPPIDIAPALLPPIDPIRWLVSTGATRHRHRIARHKVYRRHPLLVTDNRPLTTETNAVHSVWTTETVHCEVVTRTLTPVWIAHADPDTATVVLTPALFQLALQPDNPDDPTETQVSASLIPIRFEQEKDRP